MGCFPISNTVWPLSLFPYSFYYNVFVSGTPFAWGMHVRTVFTTERYSQTVIVEHGERDGRLRDCFASPVFQWGPQPERNSYKNNGTEALEQLYDERYSLHTIETSSLFVESSLCFLLFIKTKYAPWLK